MEGYSKFKADERLLPAKHEEDLFVCDVADAVLKDIMPQMEHPFYTLSKKPDTAIRRYEHNGNYVEITPSVKGIATIYDKDVLVYCISQLMAKLQKGEAITSPRIRITSHDLLKFANRGTSGREYAALSEALDRLAGTRIKTNIQTGGEVQTRNFGLIDETDIVRKNNDRDGRMLWCEIKLSDWVFNAIKEGEVLTLNRDYFRLAKPLERRVYELARKHCGQQKKWSISLPLLLKKSGSQSRLKGFKQMIKDLVKYDHLPDYHVMLDDKDTVHFHLRSTSASTMHGGHYEHESYPVLDTDTYEEARFYAKGYDVYQLEQEWQEYWVDSGRPVLKNADRAFIGFVKKKFEKKSSQSAMNF